MSGCLMDHEEATQSQAVERYLLGELSSTAHAAFEQHFFECQECAEDLIASSQLLDGVAEELGRPRPAVPAHAPPPRRFKKRTAAGSFIRAALAAGLAAVVLISGYGEWASYRQLRGEVSLLRQPSIVSAVQLLGGDSGGASIALPAGQPIVLSLNIPAGESFSRYDCTLLGPSGRVLWSLPLPAQQARQTLSISVPEGNLSPGEYTLAVHGFRTGTLATPVEVVRHQFKAVDTPHGSAQKAF